MRRGERDAKSSVNVIKFNYNNSLHINRYAYNVCSSSILLWLKAKNNTINYVKLKFQLNQHANGDDGVAEGANPKVALYSYM